MNEEQKRINEFEASKEYAALAEGVSIRLPANQAQYLQNRLRRAFQAGMKAGKAIAVDRMSARLRNIVD